MITFKEYLDQKQQKPFLSNKLKQWSPTNPLTLKGIIKEVQ